MSEALPGCLMTDFRLLPFAELYCRILNLCSRYCLAVDDRDLDALVGLFTRDGVFDAVHGPITGREAIRGYYVMRLSAYGPTLHYAHGLTIHEIDAHEVTCSVSAHAELAIGGAFQVVALRYSDRFAEEDGQLRFRSRSTRVLYSSPVDQLPVIFNDEFRSRWPGTDLARADIPETLTTWQTFYRDPSGVPSPSQ